MFRDHGQHSQLVSIAQHDCRPPVFFVRVGSFKLNYTIRHKLGLKELGRPWTSSFFRNWISPHHGGPEFLLKKANLLLDSNGGIATPCIVFSDDLEDGVMTMTRTAPSAGTKPLFVHDPA